MKIRISCSTFEHVSKNANGNGSHFVMIPTGIQIAWTRIARPSASGAPVQSATCLQKRLDRGEVVGVFLVDVVDQRVFRDIGNRPRPGRRAAYTSCPEYTHDEAMAKLRVGLTGGIGSGKSAVAATSPSGARP